MSRTRYKLLPGEEGYEEQQKLDKTRLRKNHLKWRENKGPEKLAELSRIANEKRKKTAYAKEHYAKNKEKYSEAQKKYRKEHPERRRVQMKIAKLKRKNVVGEYTEAQWVLLKRQYGNSCPSCFKSEPIITLHADHIIPITKGGSNWIENIQPLCKTCNSSKHTKIIKYNNPFAN